MLRELERRWHTLRAPIARRLRPGLSAAAIDELTTPIGVHLPTEARLWWQWHDGAEPEPGDDAAAYLSPNVEFASLAEMVAFYELGREEAEPVAHGLSSIGPEPGGQLPASWFPLGGDLVIECAVPAGACSPIMAARPGGPTPTPVAPSLGFLVQGWIALIDEGVLRIDGGRHGGWAIERGEAEPRLVELARTL